jgi:crotonobetainyl-CoA:carnitine CoA-transferase CaiB-like acyl-CoA transferase
MVQSPSRQVNETDNTLLGPMRVLDLTYETGHLCGRLLGDMGGEVIKVEPPSGDPARQRGPFYQNQPHPERSLAWWAFNYNKKGITLNIETSDGRSLLRRLVPHFDVLIESFQPGYLQGLGLGYHDLSSINPQLIMTSITPFGQEGPYANFQASDLVTMAMSGFLFGTGDTDRPPVGIAVEQAEHHGAGEAVIGILIAYYARGTTGKGQYVDVSSQQSTNFVGGGNPGMWLRTGQVSQRPGQFQKAAHPTVPLRIIYPCKDGYVNFRLMGNARGIAINRALVGWMKEEGMAQEWLEEITKDDWPYFSLDEEGVRKVENAISRFFLTHTKQELYEGSIARRVFLYAISSFQDIAESPQLAARDYWTEMHHPELGTSFQYPGPFAKLQETPIQYRYRAPLLGEHNVEVYTNLLGPSSKDLVLLRQAGAI